MLNFLLDVPFSRFKNKSIFIKIENIRSVKHCLHFHSHKFSPMFFVITLSLLLEFSFVEQVRAVGGLSFHTILELVAAVAAAVVVVEEVVAVEAVLT